MLSSSPAMHLVLRGTPARALRHMCTSQPGNPNHATAHARPFEEIPGPGGLSRLPVIGAAFLFKPFTDVPPGRVDLLSRWLHRTYGPLVRVKLAGDAVLVNEIGDMETVYRNEGRCPNRPQFAIMEKYFVQRGYQTLSMMSGEEWRSLRMRVQPPFLRPKVTNQYVPAQDHVATDFVTSLRTSGNLTPEEQKDLIFRYVLESISVFALNKRLGALDEDAMSDPDKRQFVEVIRDLFHVLGNHPVLPLYKVWPTKAYRTVARSMDFLIGQSTKYLKEAFSEIERRRAAGDLNEDEPNLILSLLLSKDVTEREVLMSMMEIFNGGTDTTTKTLYMFLYNVARFPLKQQRLAEEVREVLGDNANITTKDLNSMPYLKACLKESMRLLFPLVPGPPRFAPYDLVLSGYRVPRGTTVFLTCDAWLHDANNVTSPDDFLPERWLRDDSRKRTQTIPTVAFLPFGINTRNCLGRRFAEQIMSLFMAKVIQNFDVSISPEAGDIQVMYELFPVTTKPVPFVFTPR